jgi:hypothetical protein
VNCLEGMVFLFFVPGWGAMRVPNPAAGMMTITFMAGCKYKAAWRPFQIVRGKREADSPAPGDQVHPGKSVCARVFPLGYELNRRRTDPDLLLGEAPIIRRDCRQDP